MRESIGGAWIFMIVIVFMSILIAYIAISINYSTAYRLKSAMVTKLEEYDGLNNTSINELEQMISSYGYRQTGYCRSDDGNKYFGVLNGHITENPTKKQNYCIYRDKRDATGGSEAKYYYEITVFFGFNLPVLGDIYTFKVGGETGPIYYPNDNYFR